MQPDGRNRVRASNTPVARHEIPTSYKLTLISTLCTNRRWPTTQHEFEIAVEAVSRNHYLENSFADASQYLQILKEVWNLAQSKGRSDSDQVSVPDELWLKDVVDRLILRKRS